MSRNAPPKATSAARTRTAAPSADRRPDWRWRTFPVFTAFMLGILVALMVNGEPNNTAAAVLVWVAVIGCSYAFAHIVVVRLFLPRRARRTRTEDEYEEVVIYPEK